MAVVAIHKQNQRLNSGLLGFACNDGIITVKHLTGFGVSIQDITMSVRSVVAICLVLGALWDLFTTFYGVSYYFDLPMNPNINPGQFFFALAVTMVVFGFVIATHLVWDSKQDDTPALIFKAAVLTCIAIDLVTAWEGTKRFVFYGDEGDVTRGAGLAVVTALIVSSTIFLPKLIGKSSIGPPPSRGTGTVLINTTNIFENILGLFIKSKSKK